MKQIALINITMNAMGPMANCLKTFPGIKPVQYLDAAVSPMIAARGGVDDECMGRMLSMITRACTDGADGIILTCTVFSPYVPLFRQLFSVPIIGADVAMMEMAGAEKGRKALLCTFASTRETSTDLLVRCCEEAGVTPQVDTFVLQEAFDAAAEGDFARHNELIAEKIRELSGGYDQVVLAQMSMADAAALAEDCGVKIYTSPQAACETILALAR